MTGSRATIREDADLPRKSRAKTMASALQQSGGSVANRVRLARFVAWLVVLLGALGIPAPVWAAGGSRPVWSSSSSGPSYRSSTPLPRSGSEKTIRALGASARGGAAPTRTTYVAPTKSVAPTSGGGRLDSHEAAGGHLLAEHVGVTTAAMSARLASQPSLSETSTFSDRREAERAVGSVLKQRSSEIASWVRNGAHGSKGFSATFNGGSVLARGSNGPVAGRSARIVLQGDGRGKYFILTGYPQR